ncbi:unnamed protein product [Brassica oleracea var. botrytis]
MFMVLALVSALVFLQSQAGNYCSLENINSIPGCFDALKLATGKDISKLTRACCRAVFSRRRSFRWRLESEKTDDMSEDDKKEVDGLCRNITYIPMDLQSNNVLKAATQIISETRRNLKRSQAIEAHPASFSQSKVVGGFSGNDNEDRWQVVMVQLVCFLVVSMRDTNNDMKLLIYTTLLSLVSALVFLQSEAGNYCPTENINSIPGCFDALKLASGKDYRRLTRDCCRAVFSVIPDTCFLLLFPGKAYPIKMFRNICLNVNYVSAASPF